MTPSVPLEVTAARLRRKMGLDDAPVERDRHYRLGCLAIVRGEDNYLTEWIEFHRLMGVDHFFLYDNGASDDDRERTRSLLSSYIDADLVTHVPWPNFPDRRIRLHESLAPLSMQELAYGDALFRFAHLVRWLIKIDADEFLYPALGARGDTVQAVLDDMDDRRVAGLEVPQIRFGANGHARKPPGLVLENYTLANPELNLGWKGVAKTTFVIRRAYDEIHDFSYRSDVRPTVLGPEQASRYLRLNHYVTKSKEETLARRAAHTDGFAGGKRSDSWFEFEQSRCSTMEQRDILRYLPQLRARLAERVRPGA